MKFVPKQKSLVGYVLGLCLVRRRTHKELCTALHRKSSDVKYACYYLKQEGFLVHNRATGVWSATELYYWRIANAARKRRQCEP